MSDKEILNQCGFYEEIEEGDGCLFDRYVLELACSITAGSVQSFHALLTLGRSEFNNVCFTLGSKIWLTKRGHAPVTSPM